MRVEDIPAYEQNFDNTGVDSTGKKHNLTQRQIQVPGENSTLNYVQTKPASGDQTYFYREEANKDQIVVHYTMGYLKGDMGKLTTAGEHVSVPFVIGRNGTIYNLFYSSFWSYHLGPGAIGGNEVRSKATIGIELSNIGHLRRSNEGMKHWNNSIYCDTDQTQYLEQVFFRGSNFFATFTNAQYESLIVLLRYLTARYNIARNILPVDFRYITFDDVIGFDGIVSHVNYRASGKKDIGPAFDWDRVAAGLS
jgi:N-acetylmuramoyl-L-alanine amidase